MPYVFNPDKCRKFWKAKGRLILDKELASRGTSLVWKCLRCNLVNTNQVSSSEPVSVLMRKPCACALKRPTYRCKRTLLDINDELKSKNVECLRLSDDGKRTSLCLFRCLSCSTKFRKSYNAVSMRKAPCVTCFGSNTQASSKVEKLFASHGLTLLDTYTGSLSSLKARVNACGHLVQVTTNRLHAKSIHSSLCYECNPAKGVRWIVLPATKQRIPVRSRPEEDFLRFIHRRVSSIEAEPKKFRVSYFDPYLNKSRKYRPDFVLNDKYIVEVKTADSLGLNNACLYYKSSDRLLDEARSKARALLRKFDTFRLTLKIGDDWKVIPSEIWEERMPIKRLRHVINQSLTRCPT